MRTTLLTIMMILSSAATQAAFLPPTQPQQAPSLVCKNADMEIPESRLSVEVSAGTEENPFTFVVVKKVTTETPQEVLFSSTVSEQRSTQGAVFFANGIEMQLVSNEKGEVNGQLKVQTPTGELQDYNLTCQVYYYQAPVREAM